MKRSIKQRLLSLLLVFAMVLSMMPVQVHAAGLGTSNLTFDVENPAGYVTVCFEDYGIRPENAEIDDMALYGTSLGTIIEPTQVPFQVGDNMADVTAEY